MFCNNYFKIIYTTIFYWFIVKLQLQCMKSKFFMKRKKKKKTDNEKEERLLTLRREIERNTRQSSERHDERSLQCSVYVLLTPKLFLQPENKLDNPSQLVIRSNKMKPV